MNIKQISNKHVLFCSNQFFDLNIHLILGAKNTYLIDTGLGSDFVQPVVDYIKQVAKPLIIINTHYHWDHVFGNNRFKDCLIISHQLCRDIIDKEWDMMVNKHSKSSMGEVKKCLPNLVFENELFFPEDKIRLIYTPGHTIDSISVLDEEEKVINVGDNIGDKMEEIIPVLFCDKKHFRKTINLYKKLDMETWISGHNTVLKKDVIERIEKQLELLVE
ncbi:MBL fold metallo-hydrolase [Paenibacillus sanguinis]|uniref:MBL fold metallo-hydrolase n=1 Tax=Paenibacillus sanguinis TaxID=225906 RepID=UPI00037F179D|nr:MBL fold metallo-hydrolase [Paenibacillus sanguinis]